MTEVIQLKEKNRKAQANRQEDLNYIAKLAGFVNEDGEGSWRMAETAVRNGEAVIARIALPVGKPGRRTPTSRTVLKKASQIPHPG